MLENHAEWLDLEQYSDVPLFNTKAVVQQTGIDAPTLRAWERRYMILSPERAQIEQLSPALLCISVTISAHLTATIELGQKLQKLPSPRPTFIVGGQAFEQHPDLIKQISGIYLHGNIETIVVQIKQMAL
jgi:hypothetical protein